MLIVSMTMLVAMPVAQDVLGPVNPTDYMPAITMGSAIEADARQSVRTRRRGGGSAEETRRVCSRLPVYRAHYGRSNPNIMKLTDLCRKAGR